MKANWTDRKIFILAVIGIMIDFFLYYGVIAVFFPQLLSTPIYTSVTILMATTIAFSISYKLVEKIKL